MEEEGRCNSNDEDRNSKPEIFQRRSRIERLDGRKEDNKDRNVGEDSEAISRAIKGKKELETIE